MSKFLFIGGQEDGRWHEIPDNDVGMNCRFPKEFKIDILKKYDITTFEPHLAVDYGPMAIRCGPEVLLVYALSGMTTGAVLAKVLNSYGVPKST